MHNDISVLIESLRRGEYDDPGEKIRLLAAALREHNEDDDLIISLLQAAQFSLRLAALDACRGRELSEKYLSQLARMTADSETDVRQRLAEVIATLPGDSLVDALSELLKDEDENVRKAAIKGAVKYDVFYEETLAILKEDFAWEVREACVSAIGETQNYTFVPAVFETLLNDDDSDVRVQCAKTLERWIARDFDNMQGFLPEDTDTISKAYSAVGSIYGRFPRLQEWINERTTTVINSVELAKYGTDLTLLAQAGTLPHAYCFQGFCDTIISMIERPNPRSIVLLGNPGCGKSALVNELTYELAKPEHGEWHVLRVSPSDFMAGTKYLGEWETKVKELVETIRFPRRILLYIPNLNDLHTAGRWSKSDSNVASALAPYLDEGSVIIIGESTSQEYERGLGSDRSLRRIFDPVLVPDSDYEKTRRILRATRDASNAGMSDQVIDQLLELCDNFLSQTARPGNAAVLLNAIIENHADSAEPIGIREVLSSLSRSTGIPVDLLDDDVPLSIKSVQSFFEQRIIGQPEAIGAIIDIITLIKAGLTDPNKPMGVFLFVGPTGVGKTELARTLAEYLFGDAARLLRYDMSEYASNEGFERLIGSGQQNGMLTDSVRQNPFSVVLLDEIEKSHMNVFDLCLQIFDAGRLTDGRGATVDFRRTIVILTSNIGASTGTASRLGFGEADNNPQEQKSDDRTFRALTQYFRPEFLNRIDRIVNFRPLSLEVAERIAQREVNLVLQRSGILRRELSIDIEPTVVSMLVKEGYSQHFGARPLKRIVERMLLLPLARVIATGKIAGKKLLRLSLNDGKIDVKIISKPHPSPPVSDAPAIPQPFLQSVYSLKDDFSSLLKSLGQLEERKGELLAMTHQSSFYKDELLRVQTFDEIHRLDQFLSLADKLHITLDKLSYRAENYPPKKADEPIFNRQIEQLSMQTRQLKYIATCGNEHDLSDALVIVNNVSSQGESLNAVPQLVEMYSLLAQRWGLHADVLAEYIDDKSDRAYLQISGLGAFALFRNECGLHQFERRYQTHARRTGVEKQIDDKQACRIDCIPGIYEPDQRFTASVKKHIHSLHPVKNRIIKADLHLQLFHEQSLRSLEAWTFGPKPDALERLIRVLYAQISVTDDYASPTTVIRSYHIGNGAKVVDTRTGRTITRVKDVLKGKVDIFINEDN